VFEFPSSIPLETIERVEIDDEVFALRDAYLEASIVSKRWSDDATHVAAATVARADALVSWNFIIRSISSTGMACLP